MKRKFIVELEYDEIDEHVIHDIGVECAIEDFMDGYVATNSIKDGYRISVEEIEGD